MFQSCGERWVIRFDRALKFTHKTQNLIAIDELVFAFSDLMNETFKTLIWSTQHFDSDSDLSQHEVLEGYNT